jgi:small subunit ribosomal protein S1
MSDKEQPAEPTPEAQKPVIEDKPDRVQLLREKTARKPQQPVGKAPSLEKDLTYGFGKTIDAFDEEMERELQEAMTGFNDKEVLGEGKRERHPPAGADQGKKKGKVFRIHGQDVFIDLPGGRSQGVLQLMQFPDGPPKLGSEVEVHIEGFDKANGLLILSIQGSAVQVDWSSVARGMIVEARVTGVNKGGLDVVINSIRGFMPISQIELFRVEDTAVYVNQKLRCLVEEVDPVMNNLVVSRRALLEKEREVQKERLWLELAEGQVRDGIVRSVKDFGAFVDMGGVDGLVHVSEISWSRVEDATKVLQPGQPVQVQVLKIDRDKRKVSLGLRQLTASPWDAVPENYPIGSVVKGKVTRTTDFGAFVELEQAIEGLIHISELSPQRVRRVTDIVKVDQEVEVAVVSVDVAQRRIGLSLKATVAKEPEPEESEEEGEVVEPLKLKPRNFELRGGLGGK